MRIVVAIASIGRPQVLAQIVSHLRFQKRRADAVVVVGAAEEDVSGLAQSAPEATVLLAPKGLCRQRNAALTWAEGRADILVFFDDDFVPHADYLAALHDAFEGNPALVGATGWLAGDGAKTAPYTFDAAAHLAREVDPQSLPDDVTAKALYGCNMAFRTAAMTDLRFDERLPLYGWLEDIDFTQQLGRRGEMVRSRRLTGVHMGVRGGRTSGRRLGYSQIANVVYLYRKGTMQKRLGRRLLVNNVMSNVVGALRRDRHVDRRGRLTGNLLAARDLVLGRIAPENVLDL